MDPRSTDPQSGRRRMKFSLPLTLALPGTIFLTTCIYELLAAGNSLAQATSIRVTGALLVCCALFFCLCRLAKLALAGGGQLSAVASALLSEANSTRVAPAFVAILFCALAALALFHSPQTPVRYLLQSYLSYSLLFTSVLAGLLTLLLSCRTLSMEIEDKLIETLAVKPIGRGRYLGGKWLGLVILNGILLSVALSTIYIFSVHHIARLPARDERDALVVDDEILTARQLVPARIDPPLEKRVETYLEKNPEEIERLAHSGHRHAGDAHPELGAAEELERASERLRKYFLRRSRSIAPGKSRAFRFEGLEDLRDLGSPVLVSYRIANQPGRTLDSPPLTVTTGSAGRKVPLAASSSGQFELDPADIDADGRLSFTISNPASSPGTIIFSSNNGLEALRSRSGFLGNLLRAVLVTWIKLSFLSMLGLLCSSFLGFPVAVLLCAMVLLVSSTSPFLLQAADMDHSPDNPGGIFEALATTTTRTLANVLARYAEFNPGLQVVDGRIFSWNELGRCFLWIGLLWTGLCGTLAVLVYRRRELARIQV